MAWPIKSNPEGCVCPNIRGNHSCVECYYSQVNEHNQWVGSQSCWDAQCIVLDAARLSESDRAKFNL